MRKLSQLSEAVAEREEMLLEKSINEKNFKILLEKFSKDSGYALCKKLEQELYKLKPEAQFSKQEINRLVKNVFNIQ